MYDKFPFHRPDSKGGRITFKLYETFGENPFSMEEARKTLISANFDRIDYLPNHFKFLIEHRVLERKSTGKYAFTVGKSTNKDNKNNLSSIFYLPTKADVEYHESLLRKSPDEIISIDAVLDQIDFFFALEGKSLKANWREITKRNIEIWFGKKK